MITADLPRNIQVVSDTFMIGTSGRVGRVVPDEHGFYCGLPMMVLGIPTENKTFYNVDSILGRMQDPEGSFYKKLMNRQLFGEWGHPNFLEYEESKHLPRLLTVLEKNHSHLFRKFDYGKKLENGGVIVTGDVLPVAPFGYALKESLDNPEINTGFSLRAWIDTTIRNGIKYRDVRKMTTFDAVGAGGYPDASKKNVMGLESLDDFEITIVNNGTFVCDQLALESITDTELNEIFGTNDIKRFTKTRTIAQADPVLMERFPSLYPKTCFHDFFKG